MTSDVSALPVRLGALFAVRLALACAVLAILTLAPDAVPAASPTLLALVAAYLVVSVLLEVIRQAATRLPRSGLDAGILIDGLFVALVVSLTGGPGGVLGFVLYVHLIAVTLLVSYRTGLKVAMWQSLLLIVAYHLPPSVAGTGRGNLAATVLAIVAFLVVAIATAACSSVNERQLRRSRGGAQALGRMAHRMHDAVGAADVAETLLLAVRETVPGWRAAVYLRAEQTLVVADEDGPRPVAAQPDAAVTRSWTTGRAVLVRHLDPGVNPSLVAQLPDLHNVVVVPLLADGAPAGALVVERGGRRGVGISRSTVTLLEQLATHAALVHRNLRLLAEVAHLASVDALTDLANRRTFTDSLRREVARARRSGDPLSLLLIDLDHFKQVNDRHGHPMGDAVLRHVAKVLRERGREVDLPARYGGEEFAVLLPSCPVAEAVGVAERLREGISATDAPLPITASVGAAALGGGVLDGDDLVAAADVALYEAKRRGRDCVAAASSYASV